MKKSIMMIALLLTVVLGVQAQSLLGTWKTNIQVEDNTQMDCYMNIKSNKLLTINCIANFSDPEVGTIEFTITIPGTYTNKDAEFDVQFNSQKADAKITKKEFNGKVLAMINMMPSIKKTIDDALDKVVQEGKAELVKDIPLSGTSTIKKLTNTTLILDDGKETVTFTKVTQ